MIEMAVTLCGILESGANGRKTDKEEKPQIITKLTHRQEFLPEWEEQRDLI